MERDPSIYIILSLDTNLDCTYSTVHLFAHDGEIAKTRVEHGSQYPMPHDELSECMEWGANALEDYFMDRNVPTTS